MQEFQFPAPHLYQAQKALLKSNTLAKYLLYNPVLHQGPPAASAASPRSLETQNLSLTQSYRIRIFILTRSQVIPVHTAVWEALPWITMLYNAPASSPSPREGTVSAHVFSGFVLFCF